MTALESIESMVEIVPKKIIKNRFIKLFLDEDKMQGVYEMLLPTKEQKTKAIELLSTLSKRERQCFLLHYMENMSMGNIAKKLGVSKSSVQTYIIRARKKLEI